jgi:hypothetical protein
MRTNTAPLFPGLTIDLPVVGGFNEAFQVPNQPGTNQLGLYGQPFGEIGTAPDTTISRTIMSTVTLGTRGYVSPLTITATGAITPTALGATALVVPASVVDAIVLNQGNIIGARAALNQFGGTGVQFAARGELTNTGNISGGFGANSTNGQGGGGDGVNIAPGSTVTNSGTITGGTGRGGLIGGIGAIGVDLGSGGTLTNTGLILGSKGGLGAVGGGPGGVGADVAAGGTLINSGTIAGGAGGHADVPLGTGGGGTGVVFDGGTLINSGTIAGGHGQHPVIGAAVQFGTAAATLIVDPGAVFIGDVVANAAAADVLVLAGTTAATLNEPLGTSFVNFHTVDVNAGAHWTLFAGTNSLGSGSRVTIGAGGKLTNTGSFGLTGALSFSGAGSFTNAGTLAKTGSEVDIGTTFINSGVVSIGSGTMAFLSSVGGTGTIGIASGATGALLRGAAATQKASFPTAISHQTAVSELDLGKPASFLGTIVNFGTMDKIDLLSTPATNRVFAGGKLTVTNGTTKVATLAFSGSYTTNNFVLSSDGHAGSLITWHA